MGSTAEISTQAAPTRLSPIPTNHGPLGKVFDTAILSPDGQYILYEDELNSPGTNTKTNAKNRHFSSMKKQSHDDVINGLWPIEMCNEYDVTAPTSHNKVSR